MKGEKFHHNYFQATEIFGVIIQSAYTLHFTSTCFPSRVDTHFFYLDYSSGLTFFGKGLNLKNLIDICGVIETIYMNYADAR